jgi:hypothetical protein
MTPMSDVCAKFMFVGGMFVQSCISARKILHVLKIVYSSNKIYKMIMYSSTLRVIDYILLNMDMYINRCKQPLKTVKN